MKPELKIISDLVVGTTGINVFRNTREQRHVFGRALYYTLAREFTIYSLKEIGTAYNMDHATVLHGIRNFPIYCSYAPYLNDLYKQLRKIIPGRLEEPIEDTLKKAKGTTLGRLVNSNIKLRQELQEAHEAKDPLTRQLLKSFAYLPENKKKEIIFKTETTLKLHRLSKKQTA